MEKILTPIEKTLYYLDNAIAGMKYGTEIKEAVIICRDIVSKQLDYERKCLIDSFNDGEYNIWNYERDECYEYEGGLDYFNKNFKK